jgi:vibriolysin
MRVVGRWVGSLVLAGAFVGCGTSGLGEDGPVAQGDVFGAGTADELELAETLAYDHLMRSRRIDGIEELWTDKVEVDDLATAHVKIAQTLQGVEVLGGETIVHLKPNGSVSYVSDSLVRDLDIDFDAVEYGEQDAIELAVEATGGWDDVTNEPSARLVVTRHKDRDHLVWAVSIERMDGSERSAMPIVHLDVQTGEVVFTVDELQTVGSAETAYNGSIQFETRQRSGQHELHGTGFGSRYATWSYGNAIREPGTSFDRSQMMAIRSTTGTFTDQAAVDAHWGTEQTFAFLDLMHDWEGFDGNGGPRYKDSTMTVVVHYGTNYKNAFWNGRQITFGDGDGNQRGHYASLDVVAHEIGHAVIRNSANLVYKDESGALNEAWADILGARVESWVEGAVTDDTWRIGEDIVTPNGSSTDAMRHMNDPTAAGSSRDHYSTRYTGTADKGGVHWNSGIANLAFYLTVEGGSHPKPSKSVTTVDGIGMEKAGRIYWRALHSYMTSTTDFAGARTATLQAAADLYGQGSAEYAAVGNGWAEVGVGLPIAAPGGPIDPPSPAPEGQGNAVDVGAEKDAWRYFAVDVPPGATELDVRIQGDSGDADLYVRAGAEPTQTDYDCRPYRAGSNESCTIADPAPGTWHIGLRAWSTFSGVQLLTTIEGGVPSFLEENGVSGDLHSETHFTVDVPAGASDLEFVVGGGSGDVDLYVRQGSAPTLAEWDCRPYRPGNAETCSIPAPVPGTYHVMLRGYQAYSGVDLTGRWE